MSNDLSILEKHRDALLLAEIAAWLHMLGKFHEDFLEGNLDLAENIPDDLKTSFLDLDQLLTDTWPGKIWDTLPVMEFQATSLSIAHLIKTHQHIKNCNEGFLRLFADAHGRGSGTEKGVLARFAPQQKSIVHLSTSLGYESKIPIDLVQIRNERQKLYSFLKTQLDMLKRNDAKFSHDEWVNFRNKFVQTVELSFRGTVAETRRPLNDVTLFDQTMATVAFFKTALAYILLEGWKEPDVDDIEHKYRWRLLKIGLDGSSFWGNSIRIGDVLARKKLVTTALDEVKLLLEITYPLGMEAYRDENGSIFIIPDINSLPSDISSSQALESRIQNIALRTFEKEAKFIRLLPSKHTRNTLSFGEAVASPLPPPMPDISYLRLIWQNQEKVKDICPVCGLRPQSSNVKASARKICDVCANRRDNRSREWLKDLSSTIWIDEIADKTGRLALLTAQFDMKSWLSGTMYNTVLSFDIKPGLLKDPKRHDVEHKFTLSDLIDDIRNGLTYRNTPPAFRNKSLLGKLVLDANRDQTHNTVQAFYKIRITDTDLEHISGISDSERLALEMIRLSPSFSRIHRVWQTTQAFWQNVVSGLDATVGKTSLRLRIFGVFMGAVERLGISHTYELSADRLNISVTYVGEGEFITADNLYRTAMLVTASDEFSRDYSEFGKQVEDLLRQAPSINLEESTGYGNPSKFLGKFQITKVIPETTPYLPALPLLTQSRTFMALVPADKALEVVKQIKIKYEQEMEKVQNRLPLALGIVFADRRTPLPAILDAGRRMLKQSLEEDLWAIEQEDKVSDPKKVALTLKRNDSSLKLQIPVVMGDGTTEDAWYPYWCVEADKDGNQPEKRKRQFTSIEGKQLIHVSDLAKGDTVYLCPSRFDFELLDTAARRFEVSYEGEKRRSGMRPARPYYLEQLDSFEQLWELLSKHLAISQIDNLIGLIETKRQEWLIQQDDDVFQRAVKDILHNANWQREPLSCSEFEQLARAAVSGQLSDVVELFITILKKKNQD